MNSLVRSSPEESPRLKRAKLSAQTGSVSDLDRESLDSQSISTQTSFTSVSTAIINENSSKIRSTNLTCPSHTLLSKIDADSGLPVNTCRPTSLIPSLSLCYPDTAPRSCWRNEIDLWMKKTQPSKYKEILSTASNDLSKPEFESLISKYKKERLEKEEFEKEKEIKDREQLIKDLKYVFENQQLQQQKQNNNNNQQIEQQQTYYSDVDMDITSDQEMDDESSDDNSIHSTNVIVPTSQDYSSSSSLLNTPTVPVFPKRETSLDIASLCSQTPLFPTIPYTNPKPKSLPIKVSSSTTVKSHHTHYHQKRRCISCLTETSPCWRPSWNPEVGQLCNSCGLRYKKTGARCLNDKCRRVPAKGEWIMMQNKYNAVQQALLERGDINGSKGIKYICLACGDGVEVKDIVKKPTN